MLIEQDENRCRKCPPTHPLVNLALSLQMLLVNLKDNS